MVKKQQIFFFSLSLEICSFLIVILGKSLPVRYDVSGVTSITPEHVNQVSIHPININYQISNIKNQFFDGYDVSPGKNSHSNLFAKKFTELTRRIKPGFVNSISANVKRVWETRFQLSNNEFRTLVFAVKNTNLVSFYRNPVSETRFHCLEIEFRNVDFFVMKSSIRNSFPMHDYRIHAGER